MPVDPNQEIDIRLGAGEWNDVVARYKTSILWSEQILAKILKQAQAQQVQHEEAAVSSLGNRRSRTVATVTADGGADPAA